MLNSLFIFLKLLLVLILLISFILRELFEYAQIPYIGNPISIAS